jgi:two-component system sensor histidine kinase KdpD
MFKPTYQPFARNDRTGKNAWVLRYLSSLVLVALATGLSTLVNPEFSPTNLIMIYMLAVVVAAVYLGRGPAIVASFIGVLVFDYVFIPPKYTLSVGDTEYLLSLVGFLMVGVVISYMTTLAREQAEAAKRREAETSALYALSRDLAAADGLDAILSIVTIHMEQTFGRNVVIFLQESGHLVAHRLEPRQTAPEDLKAAEWAYQKGEQAGRRTSQFSTAWARYLPLKTSARTVGVLGAEPKDPNDFFSAGQTRLLEAFATQVALAFERVQLAEQARQMKLLQATEKLQHALLNSISHDLRTPLVSITGALSTLDEQDASLNDESRRSLIETAREEADRLNRLVGNLLDMTRLEAGAMHVKRESADVQDLIGAALGQMEERLAGREVRLDVPADLPLVPMDFVLIVHVLVNLIDNALKYSPDGSPLDLQASRLDKEVQIAILDRGLGIPPEDLTRVFDKFYRVHRPQQITGTGLGLAISKGIMEAHNGRVWAETRPGGGTIFTIALSVEAQE